MKCRLRYMFFFLVLFHLMQLLIDSLDIHVHGMVMVIREGVFHA